MTETKLVRDLMTVGVPTCKRPDMSPRGLGRQSTLSAQGVMMSTAWMRHVRSENINHPAMAMEPMFSEIS